MIEALYAELRAEIIRERGLTGLREFLEMELEFAKTEANIEEHVRLFKARTDPNYQGDAA